MTLRINCWSGPRNISTSFMYAFRQRDDTTVFDEPIYAHYLRATGREHPGRDEVLASQDPDGEAVVRDLILGEHPTPVVFFKQMAQHVVQLDRAFLGRCRNLLLIRDPERVITSFAKNVPDVNVADTGLPVTPIEAVKGGDREANAKTMWELLGGAGGPVRDYVLLNSAGVFLVGDLVTNIRDGVQLAAQTLDSGAAKERLESMIEVSQAGG